MFPVFAGLKFVFDERSSNFFFGNNVSLLYVLNLFKVYKRILASPRLTSIQVTLNVLTLQLKYKSARTLNSFDVSSLWASVNQKPYSLSTFMRGRQALDILV